jgi:Domain of unknown function (DUF4832)
MLGLTLVLFVSSAGALPALAQLGIPKPAAEEVIVRPREIDDVLTNPGIGYQEFDGDLTNPDHPASTTAYFRVYWRYVEPERSNTTGRCSTGPSRPLPSAGRPCACETYPSEVQPHAKLAFRSWWENKGVAPAYREWPLAIRLESARRTEVFPTDADVRTWLPGDVVHDARSSCPSTCRKGSTTWRSRSSSRGPASPTCGWRSCIRAEAAGTEGGFGARRHTWAAGPSRFDGASGGSRDVGVRCFEGGRAISLRDRHTGRGGKSTGRPFSTGP